MTNEENILGKAIQKSKTLSAIFVLFFVSILSVPMLMFFFGKRTTELENELRDPVSRPNLVWDSITTYPKRYDKYFNDQFPLRLSLIKTNSKIKINLLDISPLPDRVILGKDKWLFYTSCVSDTNQMQDFAGEMPLSKTTLQTIRKNILEEEKYLSERNIRFVLVMVPNKQDIYSEYLPSVFTQHKGISRMDQIAYEIKDLDYCIDMRSALLKAKSKYGDKELYYKTDTHWNQLGAMVGWEEIWKKIVPEEADPRFNFHFSKDTLGGLDLARMIAVPEMYADDYIYPIKFNLQKKFRKLLVYHDSFFGMMGPYFYNCFDSSAQVEHWGGISKSRVEKEKPDLVLLEVAERYLSVLEKPLN